VPAVSKVTFAMIKPSNEQLGPEISDCNTPAVVLDCATHFWHTPPATATTKARSQRSCMIRMASSGQ
jgi:hypothetical protein